MEQYKINNLSFTYPEGEKKAVENVNLAIDKGEYIVLCGKSGCGKSTLLRHLKKQLIPHGKREGTVTFMGTDINDVAERDMVAKVGFVMQNPEDQIVTDKVWHELAFGLESLSVAKSEMRLRVAEMASFFGIEDWFHKNVNELSGGQMQLLNLASILAMQPEVIILDEPTSQLDPIAATDFLNIIRKINVELGTTIIISEHRLSEVLPVADRVVVMEDGKIICSGDKYSVINYIFENNNDMADAMPTPAFVYYRSDKKSDNKCPVTVRDGRDYLESINVQKKIDLPADYDEDEIDDFLVKIKEIHFRYDKNGKDILKGTTLNVPRGSVYGILGGNGAGKSTLLNLLTGYYKAYSGKIKIDSKDIKNSVAMLPQDPKCLFVKNTVIEEMREMTADEDEITRIVALTGIEKLLDRHPYDLSGGEIQKVGLAKVLLCRPKLLLLDEPTKGLDCFYKTAFADILHKLKETGVTIIMVSHDIEFCCRYTDICAMLFDGQVVTCNYSGNFFAKNSFYTTSAAKMSRGIIENAVIAEDIISAINED